MGFNAIYLENAKGFSASLKNIEPQPLANREIRLAIEYSSLNYKDALAITNRAPIVRAWPMVAGIDGVGTVIESRHPDWPVGSKVIQQGWGVGEKTWGCLAQQVCVNSDGLVPLPTDMQAYHAMAIGTAGYTAMLCILALERQGVTPAKGEILVTGASGGVGSIAVALLAKLGYQVIASTAKMEEIDFLHHLGAKDVIDRSLLSSPNPKPLQKARWAGVIDAVGSYTLANALAQTQYDGVVTACGLVQGIDLPTTVAPFIFRRVQLIGIDSVMTLGSLRQQAWLRLAEDLPLAKLQAIAQQINLKEVIGMSEQLIAGKIRGRLVVNMND